MVRKATQDKTENVSITNPLRQTLRSSTRTLCFIQYLTDYSGR
jgi:hypothetical protein